MCRNLVLPPSPYIFAVLIQKWETPWAKVSPWGVLDSGDQASSYSSKRMVILWYPIRFSESHERHLTNYLP